MPVTSSERATPIPNCQNGIVKARMPGGGESCILQPLDWALAVHVSCNNVGQGWCLVSTYDDGGSWPVYESELLRVKLDGSQTLRMAHTRSSNGTYQSVPRAAVSPDGKTYCSTATWRGSP